MKKALFTLIAILILASSNFVFGQTANKSLTIVLPDKIDYKIDESFDKTGLSVIVNHADGTSEEVSDYTMSGFSTASKTSGSDRRFVTISYDDLSARFQYFVGESHSKKARRICLEKDMYGPGMTLPRSVDLSDYLPPVKCQSYPYDDNGNMIKEGYDGQMNTCLSWAFGYYCRTYLRAKTLNLSKEDLAKPENQFSPRYLHIRTYPYNDLHNGRNGTNAMNTLCEKGIATMATVPYRDFVNIEYKEEWDEEAANYRIASYDQIVSGFTVNGIKSALSKGNLIAFGANVGMKLHNCKATDVFSDDNFENTGRHVMVLCGYDDDKGANGAFKVVNSGRPNWFDNGYGWIDCDFFVRNYAVTDLEGKTLGFCHYYAYIMYADDRIVESLNVTQNRTQYYIGDWLSPNDIVVSAKYNDDSFETISDYELSGFDTKSAGEKSITISYKGKTATAKVNVDFKKHKITYIVDESVYETIENVIVGSKITLIDAPEKEGYTFSGWKCDYSNMPDKDIEITGSYSVNKYTITFVDEYGVVLQSSKWGYGQMPHYDGDDPTKASDAQYSYIFSGWDSEIVAVTCEKTYTAQFINKDANKSEQDTETATEDIGKVCVPFVLYPNPTTNVVRVKGCRALSNRYTILALSGGVVKSGLIASDDIEIDVSDLESGGYILRVGSQFAKFVKQ